VGGQVIASEVMIKFAAVAAGIVITTALLGCSTPTGQSQFAIQPEMALTEPVWNETSSLGEQARGDNTSAASNEGGWMTSVSPTPAGRDQKTVRSALLVPFEVTQ
jgi:hypothetical protein